MFSRNCNLDQIKQFLINQLIDDKRVQRCCFEVHLNTDIDKLIGSEVEKYLEEKVCAQPNQ